jgi:repressor LexA
MGLTIKQKSVYQYICSYWEQNGLAPTQNEIKDHFGFKSLGSVQRYLHYLKSNNLINIEFNGRRGITPCIFKNNTPSFSIPILGDAQCGEPQLLIENYEGELEVPPHLIPSKNNKYFALKMRGSSMIEAGIFENDIVIVKKQTSANKGDIIVAIINGEATVKKFYPLNDKIELHPANPSFTPIIVDNNDSFHLAGKIVSLMRTFS